jgi:UPF0755 protein
MPDFLLHKPKKRMRLPVIILLVILLVFGGTIGFIRYKYSQNIRPVSASQKSQLFTVELGSTASQIGEQLKEAGLIRETWAFEWYVRTNGLRDKLQAGSYYLRPSQSIPEITTVLTQGKVATDLVTILPGQRLDQIRQSLVRSGFDSGEVDAALDPEQYKNHPALVDKPADATLEGYLYPESFQKHTDTNPTTIVSASLDELQKRLTPDIRAGFVRQGLTVHQGVILASIVEQEVGNTTDRPKVAQVFLTRLKMGMQLGSDVTAFYGAIVNDQKPSVLYDSPYNTRLHPGLPPGPISNVTDSSLKAVANPASTDFLFFVAGDDGKTYFSHTVEEHEALTKQHCQRLCSL